MGDQEAAQHQATEELLGACDFVGQQMGAAVVWGGRSLDELGAHLLQFLVSALSRPPQEYATSQRAAIWEQGLRPSS
jgi:hypothetical protein